MLKIKVHVQGKELLPVFIVASLRISIILINKRVLNAKVQAVAAVKLYKQDVIYNKRKNTYRYIFFERLNNCLFI